MRNITETVKHLLIINAIFFVASLSLGDLVYDFFISKFNKEFIYYQITFNGTPNNFLKSMSEKNYNFDTQNKIWLLK